MYQEKIAYASIPDADLSTAVLAELQYHYDHDEIIKGRYWEAGKGCAVGCILKNDNHMEYETEFGIPVMLAKLEDRIFEGLPNGQSKAWPQLFMFTALSVGKTRKERMKLLQLVGWRFLYWLLKEELPKNVVGEGKIFDDVRSAIGQCADVLYPLTKGDKVDKKSAADAADAAADAAYAAAYAAADAACAAAYAAAYAAGAAYAAAGAGCYQRMADKLIELINEAVTQGDGHAGV